MQLATGQFVARVAGKSVAHPTLHFGRALRYGVQVEIDESLAADSLEHRTGNVASDDQRSRGRRTDGYGGHESRAGGKHHDAAGSFAFHSRGNAAQLLAEGSLRQRRCDRFLAPVIIGHVDQDSSVGAEDGRKIDAARGHDLRGTMLRGESGRIARGHLARRQVCGKLLRGIEQVGYLGVQSVKATLHAGNGVSTLEGAETGIDNPFVYGVVEETIQDEDRKENGSRFYSNRHRAPRSWSATASAVPANRCPPPKQSRFPARSRVISSVHILRLTFLA